MITLKDINMRYGEKVLFEEGNLLIEDNQFIGITGKSGSGKSTLLNIMSLLEKPTKGEVLWNGESIRPNTLRARSLIRHEIGYLFQNYALIDDATVFENVYLALQYNREVTNRKEAVRNALLAVGLDGYAKRKIFTLSGGEQQRVALARILIKPCSVIFADEPTGNLDRENADAVMAILKELNKSGKTIVLVTHDMENLRGVDGVIVIQEGHILQRFDI